jgi:sialate O-acetylesterase
VLSKYVIENDKIRLLFDHGDGLKPSSGNEITGFTLAGKDGKHYPAKAVIQNGTILLSSDQVKSPAIVHYAFADWPACNLVNGAGLPASPFRTDVKDGL